MHPFEDVKQLEKMCTKYDHSLFAFGSSSKKRPLRLVLGRLFAHELLDMQEFAVKDYKSCQSFGKTSSEAMLGSKPLVLFQGSTFESDERMKRSKSLLLDYFSASRPQKIMLQGLDQVVVCSAMEGASPAATDSAPPAISVKRFRLKMVKSGSRLPHVELDEIGPSFKIEVDRTKDPDRDRWKQAIKIPKEVKVKKVKNISKDSMGKRSARIHLGKQDFDQIHTVHHGESKRKKMKDAEKGAAQGAAAEVPAKRKKTKQRRAAAMTVEPKIDSGHLKKKD
jgi:ribosome production factor 2